MVLSGDPAVDKKVVFMEQDSGHGPEKGQLFGKQRLNGLPGGVPASNCDKSAKGSKSDKRLN